MYELRGYFAKWMSQTEKYDMILFICGILKSKRNKHKQNRNRPTDTKNKLVGIRGWNNWELGKIVEGIKRHTLPIIK